MNLRRLIAFALSVLPALLLGSFGPAPAASALVPPEPPAAVDAPVGSWLVQLEGPSVYRRLIVSAEGRRRIALGDAKAVAPLARPLEVKVLAGQEPAIAAAEGLGARVISRYSAGGNGLLLHATAAQAAAMALRPDVLVVEPAPIVRPNLASSRPHIGAARLAQEMGLDGTGSYVAIIDTGVDYTHAHLGGPGNPAVFTAAAAAGPAEVITDTYGGELIFPNAKVVAGWDFVGRRYNPPHICSDDQMAAGSCTNIPEPDPDPLDGGNHGTHVSGIVGGKAIDGIGDGIAPGAGLVGLKVYGTGGADEAADVLADAIDYTARVNMGIEDRGVFPPRIDGVNISLGEDWAQGSRLFDEIVEAATGVGVMIAASAGNSGDVPFIVGVPSASPKVLSVASSVPPSEVLAVVANWDDTTESYGGVDSSIASFEGREAVDAELGWFGRACNDDAQEQEVTEKVALIARGTCNFSEKILNAQAAGAIAVLMFSDNRAKNGMGGDGAGIDIPAVMIDNDKGVALSELLIAGTAVSVQIDPASKHMDPSTADAVSGFSSRGPSKNGALKPDITAPGSGIVSALAGSGTGGAAFSGTSMASPMMAGAAGVIQQRNRQEKLGLDGTGIAALLMNYARPVIYSGNRDNPVPIVRQGGGLVDVWGSGTGEILVRAGDIASLNLGMVSLTETWHEMPTIAVHNLGDAPISFTVAAGFQYAEDENQGLTIEAAAGVHTLEAGASLELPVHFNFNPAALRAWDQWPTLAGSDTGALQTLEIDGYLVVAPAEADGGLIPDVPVVTVPFYALPRQASAIRSPGLPAALDEPESTLTLGNDSEFAGSAELYVAPDYVEGVLAQSSHSMRSARPVGPFGPAQPSGLAQSDHPAGADPDEPQIREELDIRQIGLRIEPPTDAITVARLGIAIARHARAPLPHTSISSYAVYLDTTGDGQPDFRIREVMSQGEIAARYAPWDAISNTFDISLETGDFVEHRADLFGYLTTISVPLAELGLDPADPGPVQLYLVNRGNNEDWRFEPGTRYDLLPTWDVAPDGALDESGAEVVGGPRFVFDPASLARVPDAWAVELGGGTSSEVAFTRGPGENDATWMLIYPQNAHDDGERQMQAIVPGHVEPPKPKGIFLPLLLRAFDWAAPEQAGR